MTTLKPLGDRLLVTPVRREKKWGGRIHLLEKNRSTLMGEDHFFWVVAVGSKVTDIKPKDRVVLSLDHEGVDYLDDGTMRGFVRRHQVLCVFTHDGFQTPPSQEAAP